VCWRSGAENGGGGAATVEEEKLGTEEEKLGTALKNLGTKAGTGAGAGRKKLGKEMEKSFG